MKFDIGKFCEKIPNNFSFHSDWAILTTSLHEDLHACFCGHPRAQLVEHLSERNMFRKEIVEKNEARKHVIVAC
jgi:hypothetical protein